MKKLLALLLALCMLLSLMVVLTGCEETGKKKKTSASRDDDADEDDEDEEDNEDNEENTDPEDDREITDPDDGGDVTEYPVPPQLQYGNQVGQYCPSATLKVVNSIVGEVVDPSATGKITIVNFWFNQAESCTNQLFNFEALLENYDICIIAIHAAFGEEYMQSYITQYHPNSSIVFASDTLSNGFNGDFYITMGDVGYYPYSLLLDENGMIVKIFEGGQSYQDMESAIVDAGAQLREGGEATGIQVMDNYFCLQESEYLGNQGVRCCHIPAVYYNGVYLENVNTAMYEELTSYISEWGPKNMIYEWSFSGDVLSVIVRRRIVENDHTEYEIYNISLSQDRFLSQDEFYEALGTTRSTAMGWLTNMHENFNYNLVPNEYMDQSVIDWMKESNLSQENLDNSVAFIGFDNTIHFKTYHYVPAGSGISVVLYGNRGVEYQLTEENHQNCAQ